jgi:hypothetical protein
VVSALFYAVENFEQFLGVPIVLGLKEVVFIFQVGHAFLFEDYLFSGNWSIEIDHCCLCDLGGLLVLL